MTPDLPANLLKQPVTQTNMLIPENPIVISGMRGLPLKISQPCHFEDCLATGEICNTRTEALFVFCQHVSAV